MRRRVPYVRRDGASPEFRIFAVPEGVKAVIEGITIQGGVDFRGGGIENFGDYSTVARNTGRSIATLQQGSSTLLLRIRGSIVEGPWGTNSGQQTSLGYNLWLNIPPIDTHVTDMVDPSAVLDALKNNGGPTETIALSLEDQTRLVAPCEQDSGELLTVDQRGFPRPVWYGCTVGAHEPNSAWLVIPTPIAPGAECATGGQRVGAASFGASSCVIKSSALSHIISDILVLPRRPRSQRAVNVDEPGATGPGGRCVV